MLFSMFHLRSFTNINLCIAMTAECEVNMKVLAEPKSSILTIGYHPDNEKITENPPRFTWMPESEKDLAYCLQISRTVEFKPQSTMTYRNIPYNFFTLEKVLEAGDYYWRYTLEDSVMEPLEKTYFSAVRKFEVSTGIPETPLDLRSERYQNTDMSHPRIWLNRDEIEKFKMNLKEDANYCNFNIFYENSVLVHAESEFVNEPARYPEDKRVVNLWRGNYQQCQVALEYIRSLSVAGVILENEEYMKKAKDALLSLTEWDLNGSTSRDYNDECSFRVVYALAFGYDWLYYDLSQEEKESILHCLFIRTKQVADHIIKKSRIHLSLYDSHAVRSLSSVIIPCCIAMLGEMEEAKEWLDYAIEYFNVIYTPWGGDDGGWAEGGLYWTTGMAFVIEALNTLKNFMNIDIYKRPFFKKTGDFPLYCMPVDTYRASFCDQSNLGKYPGHKTAYNMRQFGGITGNADYLWYYNQVLEREKEIDKDFFNKGWWDFYFDDMVYLHDYGNAELKEKEPEHVKWFRDIGWVAIHKNLKKKEDHIFLLTKSSPYGSVSHSHGDQNSFVLFAYEEPLIIKSGYYIGFNTSMHRDWRRQTLSHNNILINGKGQYAEMDKSLQLQAKGEICEVAEHADHIYVKEDATKAYQITAPELLSYTREIYFVNEAYFIIVDTVKTKEASEIDWLLHSLSPFSIKEDRFEIKREKAGLIGNIVYCSSGIKSMTEDNVFSGVNEEEIKDLENQWHLTMKSGSSDTHHVVSLLVPYKAGKKEVVNCVKDDQGMDKYFYFIHDGKNFSLCIKGKK